MFFSSVNTFRVLYSSVKEKMVQLSGREKVKKLKWLLLDVKGGVKTRGRKCVNVMTDLYVNWIDRIGVN